MEISTVLLEEKASQIIPLKAKVICFQSKNVRTNNVHLYNTCTFCFVYWVRNVHTVFAYVIVRILLTFKIHKNLRPQLTKNYSISKIEQTFIGITFFERKWQIHFHCLQTMDKKNTAQYSCNSSRKYSIF